MPCNWSSYSMVMNSVIGKLLNANMNFVAIGTACISELFDHDC